MSSLWTSVAPGAASRRRPERVGPARRGDVHRRGRGVDDLAVGEDRVGVEQRQGPGRVDRQHGDHPEAGEGPGPADRAAPDRGGAPSAGGTSRTVRRGSHAPAPARRARRRPARSGRGSSRRRPGRSRRCGGPRPAGRRRSCARGPAGARGRRRRPGRGPCAARPRPGDDRLGAGDGRVDRDRSAAGVADHEQAVAQRAGGPAGDTPSSVSSRERRGAGPVTSTMRTRPPGDREDRAAVGLHEVGSSTPASWTFVPE